LLRPLLLAIIAAVAFPRNIALCEEPKALREAEATAARGDLVAARRLLEQYLKEHPHDAGAMRQLAYARFFRWGEANDAYELLKEAYRIDPQDRELPELALARLYAGFGDLGTAEVWASSAIKRGADECSAKLMLARCALKCWQPQVALRQAEQVLKLDPRSLDAKVVQAQVALSSKDYKNAQRLFALAVLQAPENFAARDGMALALCEQGDEASRKQALPFAEANFKHHPKDLEAAITYGRVLYRLGRIEDADKAVQSVVTAGADMGPSQAYFVACIAAARGRKDEAREMIRLKLAETLNSEHDADEKECPGDMRQEMVALLKTIYPSEPIGLKPGETVIAIRRRTCSRPDLGVPAGSPYYGGGAIVSFCGGTRLKVLSSVRNDDEYMNVQDEHGLPITVPRRDFAKESTR
jgi:tetratricopeptide (TPR) repeat protein